MSRKYTDKELEWIREHSHFATTVKAMCEQFNAEFNRNIAQSDYSRLYNRVTGTTPRTIRLYPDEVIEFIKNECKGINSYETADKVNGYFNTNYSQSQIARARQRYHIPSGVDARFTKNQQPWNKGKKIQPNEKSIATQFKKGNIPPNHKEIGDISLRKDKSQKTKQVYYIKVDNDKWELLNRYVWEQNTGEKLTDNDVIAYADGNSLNCEFSNLRKITRAQNAMMNRYHLRIDDEEMFNTSIAVADLITKRGKLKK